MLGLENMLRGMIPPEILAALTPEKIKEYGDHVNAFITLVREQLDRIEAKVDALSTEKLNGHHNPDAPGTSAIDPPGS